MATTRSVNRARPQQHATHRTSQMSSTCVRGLALYRSQVGYLSIGSGKANGAPRRPCVPKVARRATRARAAERCAQQARQPHARSRACRATGRLCCGSRGRPGSADASAPCDFAQRQVALGWASPATHRQRRQRLLNYLGLARPSCALAQPWSLRSCGRGATGSLQRPPRARAGHPSGVRRDWEHTQPAIVHNAQRDT